MRPLMWVSWCASDAYDEKRGFPDCEPEPRRMKAREASARRLKEYDASIWWVGGLSSLSGGEPNQWHFTISPNQRAHSGFYHSTQQ